SPEPVPPAIPANAEPSSGGARTSACSRWALATRTASAGSRRAGGSRIASVSARPPFAARLCSSREATSAASPSCAASTESATVAISGRAARSSDSTSARICVSAAPALSLPPWSAVNAPAAAASSCSDEARAPNVVATATASRSPVLIASPPAEQPCHAQLHGQLAFPLGVAADARAVQHLARANAHEEAVREEDALADAHASAQRPARAGAGDRIGRDALEQQLRPRRHVGIEVDRLLAGERELPVDRRPAHLHPAHHPDVAGRRPQPPGLGAATRRVGADVDGRREQGSPSQRMSGNRPTVVQVVLDAHSDQDAAEERIADRELEHRLGFG